MKKLDALVRTVIERCLRENHVNRSNRTYGTNERICAKCLDMIDMLYRYQEDLKW